MIKRFDIYNESVRNHLLPKSKEEIDDIISEWTPREKFLKSFQIYKTIITDNYLYNEAKKLMKPFDDIRIGDLLTISPYPGINDIPLSEIKSKHTFNNKSEFDEFMSKTKVIIADNEIELIYKNYPNTKVDAVVVNITLDHIFVYGKSTGVFPYTKEEIEKHKSKLKDMSHLMESLRDKMTPKSQENIIESVIDKILDRYSDESAFFANDKYLLRFGVGENTMNTMSRFGNGIYIHFMNSGYYTELKEFFWEKNIMFTQCTSTEIKIMSRDKIRIVLYKLISDVLNDNLDNFMIRKFNYLMR